MSAAHAIHFMKAPGKPGATVHNLPYCGLGWTPAAPPTNNVQSVTCKACLRRLEKRGD